VTPSPKYSTRPNNHDASKSPRPDSFNFSESKPIKVLSNKDQDFNFVKSRIESLEASSVQSTTEMSQTSQPSIVRDRLQMFDKRNRKGPYNFGDDRSQVSNESFLVANFVKELEERSMGLSKKQEQLERQIRRQLSLPPNRARKQRSINGIPNRNNLKTSLILPSRSKSASSAIKASNVDSLSQMTLRNRNTPNMNTNSMNSLPQSHRRFEKVSSSPPMRRWSMKRSPIRIRREKYSSVSDHGISAFSKTDDDNSKKYENMNKGHESCDSDLQSKTFSKNSEISISEYIPVTLPLSRLAKKSLQSKNKVSTQQLTLEKKTNTESKDHNKASKLNKSEVSLASENNAMSPKFHAKFYEAAHKLNPENSPLKHISNSSNTKRNIYQSESQTNSFADVNSKVVSELGQSNRVSQDKPQTSATLKSTGNHQATVAKQIQEKENSKPENIPSLRKKTIASKLIGYKQKLSKDKNERNLNNIFCQDAIDKISNEVQATRHVQGNIKLDPPPEVNMSKNVELNSNPTLVDTISFPAQVVAKENRLKNFSMNIQTPEKKNLKIL